MIGKDSIFDFVDGVPHFHGLPVKFRSVVIGDRSFELATLHDPAALLDQPDFARAFIEEDRAPYGLELWPASIALASHLVRHDPGQARPALEIGCGVGLVSLAAATAGWHVTAADYDEAALNFTSFNAARNGITLHGIELLDWGKPIARPPVERIFAADVLYQLVDHAPILACLSQWLTAGGEAIIADPGRGIADRFPAMARRAGFRVADLNLDPGGSIEIEGAAHPSTIRAWRLRRLS